MSGTMPVIGIVANQAEQCELKTKIPSSSNNVLVVNTDGHTLGAHVVWRRDTRNRLQGNETKANNKNDESSK